MRVVLDTSVFIAAALSARGGSSRLIRLWLEEARLTVVLSPRLIAEVQAVLLRPKLDGRIQPDELSRLLAALARRGEVWPDKAAPPPLSRDPDDDYLLGLALEARVDALVSLDRDLLDLGYLQGRLKNGTRRLPVLTPGALLALLRQAGLLED